MARQMLSLLAGDAIDLWLVRQLKGLTSGHSVARAILSLQSILWPGGVWFSSANQQRDSRHKEGLLRQQREIGTDPIQDDSAGEKTKPWVPSWQPPSAMRADRFLEPATRPADEDDMRSKALERMLSKCPSAVTAILGQKNYAKSVTELHSMIQSSTFTLQV